MAKAKKIANLSDLTPDTQNANKGTERGRYMVEASLTETGAGRSIVADKDGRIIAGNKTLEAWAGMGGAVKVVETDGNELVVVQRTDLDLSDPKGKARKLAYYDNRAGQVGLEWDAEQLLADVNAGVDLAAMFKADEIAELLAGVKGGAEADAEPQIDQAEELNKKWQVKTGDLWRIGAHRLLCGDSTKAADVARVMGGERAALCFTSPPYNAGVSAQLSGNTSVGDNLYRDHYDDNKSAPDYLQLLSGFTALALNHSQFVFVNIQPLAGNKRALVEYWHKFSDRFADVAVWDKGHAAPAQAQRVMDSRFEFVIVLSENASRAIGTRQFRGMVPNVYTGPLQRDNVMASAHGATFPVHLPTHFIQTFSNMAESIYEPFAGSGTTIVACENLGRKCRAIEISPAYCAVILERMAQAFPKLEITQDDGDG